MKRYFFGLVLIAVGVVAMLNMLGTVPYTLPLWHTLLGLLGLSILASSLRKLSWFGIALGAWLGGIGIVEVLFRNNLTNITGGQIASSGWAILLVGLGLGMLFGRRAWWHKRRFKYEFTSNSRIVGDLRYGQGRWKLDRDMSFDHGVGDVKIDLTTADITDGVHTINVNQWVGDCLVRVPNNVSVIVDATVNVGELEVLGDHRSGMGLSLQKSYVVPDATAELRVFVRQSIGQVRVIQSPAAGPRLVLQ